MTSITNTSHTKQEPLTQADMDSPMPCHPQPPVDEASVAPREHHRGKSTERNPKLNLNDCPDDSPTPQKHTMTYRSSAFDNQNVSPLDNDLSIQSALETESSSLQEHLSSENFETGLAPYHRKVLSRAGVSLSLTRSLVLGSSYFALTAELEQPRVERNKHFSPGSSHFKPPGSSVIAYPIDIPLGSRTLTWRSPRPTLDFSLERIIKDRREREIEMDIDSAYSHLEDDTGEALRQLPRQEQPQHARRRTRIYGRDQTDKNSRGEASPEIIRIRLPQREASP